MRESRSFSSRRLLEGAWLSIADRTYLYNNAAGIHVISRCCSANAALFVHGIAHNPMSGGLCTLIASNSQISFERNISGSCGRRNLVLVRRFAHYI
jgi:hypothetical protein